MTRRAITNDLAFRIGGPAVFGGNSMYAYDGDIAQVAIYREAHDHTTKRQVLSWLNTYQYTSNCPTSIATPNTGNQWYANTCINGAVGSNCWQDCSGGYSRFIGVAGDHYCQSNYWTNAPLICRRQCPDVAPPRYTAACSRQWLSMPFNASDSTTMLTFITWPTLRIVNAQRTWFLMDGASAGAGPNAFVGDSVLVGNTTVSDACARISPAANIFAIHPTRWSTFIPYGVQVVVSAAVSVDNAGAPGSSGGIVFRFNDQNNHYRASISVATGLVSLFRVSSGRAVLLASAPVNASTGGMNLASNQWVTLSATALTPSITVSINNVTLISVYDTAGPSYGSAGLWIDTSSVARFDNFTLSSGCDLAMVARYIMSGMQVTMQW